MREYFIDITKYTERNETDGTYDAEGNYNYDHSWEQSTNFTVQGVYSKSSVMYDGVLATTNFEEGETGYLLLIASGDGDSAGHAINNTIEGVHLFKNEKLAQLAIYLIKKDAIQKKHNLNIIKIKSDVEYIDINTITWKDYFGGIDALHFYKVVVGSPVAELILDITYMNITEVELNTQKLEQLVYIEDEQKTLDQNLLNAQIRKPNKI